MNDNERKVMELEWNRLSVTDLSKKLGVSDTTIIRWARQIGLLIKKSTQGQDLSGQKIGKVYVLENIGSKNYKGKTKVKYYKCKCDCGNIVNLWSFQLSRNQQPSCPKCKLSPAKDIAGKRFGRLLAIKPLDKRTKQGLIRWECKCDCGKTTSVRISSLINGHTQSCGCYLKECRSKRYHDWTNTKFGRLVAIKRIGDKWECRCDCGNVAIIATPSLVTGVSRSCGCLRSEKMSGENSRFWKGGITEIIRGIKHTSKYFIWAKKVKKRDNYTCQCCASKNSLNSHHILNFIDNMEKAIELDNGITLCEKCHKDFHHIYGKRNTNSEKLLDFLRKNAILIGK